MTHRIAMQVCVWNPASPCRHVLQRRRFRAGKGSWRLNSNRGPRRESWGHAQNEEPKDDSTVEYYHGNLEMNKEIRGGLLPRYHIRSPGWFGTWQWILVCEVLQHRELSYWGFTVPEPEPQPVLDRTFSHELPRGQAIVGNPQFFESARCRKLAIAITRN